MQMKAHTTTNGRKGREIHGSREQNNNNNNKFEFKFFSMNEIFCGEKKKD